MLRRMKDEKGQALTEFALVLPILLFLIMATIQFGFALNSYLVLTGLARDAARVGSVTNDDSEIHRTIQQNNPTLDASKISITISPSESARHRGDQIQISLKYPVPIIVPLIGSITGDELLLSTSITMRVE
jgi:Flp pilus assembly protein TadG